MTILQICIIIIYNVDEIYRKTVLLLSINAKMKKLVLKTIDRYSISTVDVEGIKTMITGEGYTVIRFSAAGHRDETQRLLTALYLEERTSYLDSFTYNDRERRIVFIRKDISEDEFLYLLALELGRILTFKTECDGVIGISAEEDRIAHEFAHHLLDIADHGLIYNFFKIYTGPGITFAVSAVIAISFLIAFFTLSFLMKPKPVSYDNVNDNNTVTAPENSKSINYQDDISVAVPFTDVPDDASDIVASDSLPYEENNQVYETTVQPESVDDANDNRLSIFYSTKSGKKYHLPECGYISGKTVVPVYQNDIDNGVYSPCSRCIK